MECWISSMTRHLYWKDYAPADYVTAASSYLTGIALRNWESAYITLDRAGKDPEEYQTFPAQMRFDYGQTHREGRIREDLLVSRLNQTGNLENYCTTFRNKVRELYCKPLSAETEVLLFRKGLKSKNLRDRCDYMPGTQDDFNNLKSIQDHVLKIAGSDGRGEKEREEGGAGPEPKSKGHGHENAKPPSSGMQSQKSQKNSKNKPDAAQATGRLDQDSREYKFALEKGVCLYCAKEGHMSGRCPEKANGKPRVSIRVPHNWEPKDRKFHDVPSAGHVGTDKTRRAVPQHYWWPHITADVIKYVQTCPACQMDKPSNQVPAGLYQPLQLPRRPWSSVSMDFITQLPMTKNGNDAIFVVVDRLTKMAHFIPTKTTATAEDTARLFLDNVFRLHGLPEEIISNRDSKFTGNFWQALFECLGTRLGMPTAFHPQTDGQTERMNITLEDMLRHYVGPDHDDWEEVLSSCEFCCE